MSLTRQEWLNRKHQLDCDRLLLLLNSIFGADEDVSRKILYDYVNVASLTQPLIRRGRSRLVPRLIELLQERSCVSDFQPMLQPRLFHQRQIAARRIFKLGPGAASLLCRLLNYLDPIEIKEP